MTPNLPAGDAVDWTAVVGSVRALANLPEGVGPDDVHVAAGVRGFANAFTYWYGRVISHAVPDYRNLIIKRINPFIRRIQLDGLDVKESARRLVEDYDSRNFVTAGGWALEQLASDASLDAQKSAAEGIDLQRFDPATGNQYLYVLKSGLVTRNSDIVKALKRNSRQAEKLLRQDKSGGMIVANWVVLAGKTQSSFEDGVRRPSSAEFWGEILGLGESDGVALALAMSAVAGQLLRNDLEEHLDALRLVVGDYMAERDNDETVDWEFIARRNMQTLQNWQAEDRKRHKRAMDRLAANGYVIAKKNATRSFSP
jgi:Type II restriction endonuclease EcoO109I